jgi:hypothetical protein
VQLRAPFCCELSAAAGTEPLRTRCRCEHGGLCGYCATTNTVPLRVRCCCEHGAAVRTASADPGTVLLQVRCSLRAQCHCGHGPAADVVLCALGAAVTPQCPCAEAAAKNVAVAVDGITHHVAGVLRARNQLYSPTVRTVCAWKIVPATGCRSLTCMLVKADLLDRLSGPTGGTQPDEAMHELQR